MNFHCCLELLDLEKTQHQEQPDLFHRISPWSNDERNENQSVQKFIMLFYYYVKLLLFQSLLHNFSIVFVNNRYCGDNHALIQYQQQIVSITQKFNKHLNEQVTITKELQLLKTKNLKKIHVPTTTWQFDA